MQDSFSGVLAFAFLGALLLSGTALRARVAWLRNALVPASLIGGLLGFTLLALDLGFGYESRDFAVFTFHFFTLSFMSLVLTGRDPDQSGSGSVVGGGSWLAVIWVMSLVLQALIGLAVVLAYNGVAGTDLSAYLGLMVTHGFTQGPGQAMALGGIWEQLGVLNAVNFGVIYASLGFVAAFFVGVPVARAAVRRGANSNRAARLDAEFISGLRRADARVVAGYQVTHSANVDSLAFHFGILGLAYLLTDQYLQLMQPLVAPLTLGPVHLALFFDHNLFFLHGLMVCLLLRRGLDASGLGRFIDNETQRRITGSAVDFMVVATLMSIQFGLLAQFALPIALVCVSVTAATAMLCFGFGRLLTRLGPERALTAFGCCCGSTGSGLLLLRVLDPDLSTPIARELAFFNLAIIVFGFHVLTLMAPQLPNFSLGTVVVVYSATLVIGAVAAWLLSRRLARSS